MRPLAGSSWFSAEMYAHEAPTRAPSHLPPSALGPLLHVPRVLLRSVDPLLTLASAQFFQLPPVGMERDRSVRFLFETDAWHEAELLPIVLTQTFRQKDGAFITLLDEMRRARLSPFSIAQLKHHVHHPPAPFVRGPVAAPPPPSLEVKGGEAAGAAAGDAALPDAPARTFATSTALSARARHPHLPWCAS